MPTIEFAQTASPVEYILFAFMAMNMALSGVFLIHQGYRKLRLVRAS